MSDKIEKQVELKAPVEKVWKSLTDHRQFGEWFGVKIDQPFASGEKSTGQFTLDGCDDKRWNATVQKIEPQRLFSWTWHPYAMDPNVDYSHEEPTLVEFTLEAVPGGTLLKVVESGFDRVPEHRRAEAFQMDERGWGFQLENIERYVS